VPETSAPFNQQYLVRSSQIQTLKGEPAKGGIVVIAFDSAGKGREWYDSTAYAAISPIRQSSAKSRIFIVEGVAPTERVRGIPMPTNGELAREYIRAIENGATGEALARFFTQDVAIKEMPNRAAPHGSASDLTKALQAAERGQKLFKRQTYTITNILCDGDWVALEMDWFGVIAVPIQNLPPNSEMRDHAATFLYFRDGRIARQHHYDCFEPW